MFQPGHYAIGPVYFCGCYGGNFMPKLRGRWENIYRWWPRYAHLRPH